MLEILDPGMLSTVQDGGRTGWARYGVPPSGPMDAAAFWAANRLVGNHPNAAALEITLTGPTLRIRRESLVAICGASFEVYVGRLPVPNWHAVYVRPGQTLTFGKRHMGMWAYLAISGGLTTLPFLGSRATYLKGQFGGYEGRALRPGDRLPLGNSNLSEPVMHAGQVWAQHLRPKYTSLPILRVILGPQHDYFNERARQTFLKSTYTLTTSADRMGYRLQGPKIHQQGSRELPSEGIMTGSIQIPPDGQPIVMMVDHQTTGGYPKIATVIQADISLLAQCQPGDAVTFRAIDLEQARKLYAEHIAISNT